MKPFLVAALMLGAILPPVHAAAAGGKFWRIASPDHEQTWAYATETDRVWKNWRGHLALLLSYTNDPFVDRQNPRQYDNFRFDFPSICLGPDGRTFFYQAASGRAVPIAIIHSGFLGMDEVRLLPNVKVFVQTPRGVITVVLDVVNDPAGPGE